MSFEEKYRKSLEDRWCLRLDTSLPDDESYDGVVIGIASEFIAIREENDFQLDGAILLLKRIITDCRDGKYERCCNAILRENGAVENLVVPDWLGGCNTISEVMAELHRQDIWPGIEVFREGALETDFFLGPITEVEESTCRLHCYDATGEWEQLHELKYDEICRIEYDSLYCNAFNNHMRNKARQ